MADFPLVEPAIDRFARVPAPPGTRAVFFGVIDRGSLDLADLIEQFAKKDLGLEVSQEDYLNARFRKQIAAECQRAAARIAR